MALHPNGFKNSDLPNNQTLPIAAYTLAFARSLSETGATFIVAAGVFSTVQYLSNSK
jgi:ABC-type sulfate transport system permease component